MIKIDSSLDTYNENLGKAYDSRLSKEDKIILRDYFSSFVSNSFAKKHPVPEKALKALKHIDKSLHNIELQAKDDGSGGNWQSNIKKYSALTIICGLLVLIIFHYLSPHLPSFIGF